MRISIRFYIKYARHHITDAGRYLFAKRLVLTILRLEAEKCFSFSLWHVLCAEPCQNQRSFIFIPVTVVRTFAVTFSFLIAAVTA